MRPGVNYEPPGARSSTPKACSCIARVSLPRCKAVPVAKLLPHGPTWGDIAVSTRGDNCPQFAVAVPADGPLEDLIQVANGFGAEAVRRQQLAQLTDMIRTLAATGPWVNGDQHAIRVLRYTRDGRQTQSP